MPNLLSFVSFNFVFLLAITATDGNNDEASALISWLQQSPFWIKPNANPCNWTYITCSEQNRITDIHIISTPLHLDFSLNVSAFVFLQSFTVSGANLTGVIPQEIGSLPDLTVVDLSQNKLSGSIPSSFGNLNKLQELILYSNKLSGGIPPELGRCRELRSIVIFANELAGVIPMEIGNLTKLEVFRAGGNGGITGEIPLEIFNCRKLRIIGIAETKISGEIPAAIGMLQNLDTFSMYTTMISGKIPPEMGNCTELVHIYLFQNNLSGSIPPEICELKKLEELNVWQNFISGSVPVNLGNCSRLKIVEISSNLMSGVIPNSIGDLTDLKEFYISNNEVAGEIPKSLSNCRNMTDFQVYLNRITGSLPEELGLLSNLVVFFAWGNFLQGEIPVSFTNWRFLQQLDISENFLSGSIPSGLFQLPNLTKLLLLSNNLTGVIPLEIGSSKNVVRLRLSKNRISGEIPAEIGMMKSLVFLDLAGNLISGNLPAEIASCPHLAMVDISRNLLEGSIPASLLSPSSIQVLDVSYNRLDGDLPSNLGRSISLSKLVLRGNRFTGKIPPEIGISGSLQLLDLSNNRLTGRIPKELGQIGTLEIALNLSFNRLTGGIPVELANLNKLSTLDISHNELDGTLAPLSGFDNLVSLNISWNKFTGLIPTGKPFHLLSGREIAGNNGLCPAMNDTCSGEVVEGHHQRGLLLALWILIAGTLAMAAASAAVLIRRWKTMRESGGGDESLWEFTPFQKVNFSVTEVLGCLTETNVIGKGLSGVVYRVELDSGEALAVKKLWPTTTTGWCCPEKDGVRDSFSAEMRTLGTVRHRNIVKFFGFCWNRNTRVLMYEHMMNGSLDSLLHERNIGWAPLEWSTRYKILLGSAQGLSYLHHDCVPPIVHRYIKPNNILIGLDFEPYISDFGLASLIRDDSDFSRFTTSPGSHGYSAPEHGYGKKITEKSDVYSYGVVAMEVLTGRRPTEGCGPHIVDWVRQRRRRPLEVLDSEMVSQPDPEAESMVQALRVALLCVNRYPEERPTMKEVVAMLKEIKEERDYVKMESLDSGKL